MTAPIQPPSSVPASLPPFNAPRSPAHLFVAFSLLALQGFGGVLAIVQRDLVERKRWLTQEEFIEEWAVTQIMPGPNVVNLTLVLGARYFGLRGALAALAGMLTFPLLLVLCLAVLHAQYAAHPGVAGALRGMGAVAAGMIAATGLKLAVSLRSHPLRLPLALSAAGVGIVLVAVLRVPMLYTLLGLGGLCCVLTYRRLAR